MASDLLLFNPKYLFLAILWGEQVAVDEMIMMMSALYYYAIVLQLAHWNNSRWEDMSLYSDTVILLLSQPVFACSPYCCVLCEEKNKYKLYIVVDLTRPGLKYTIYNTTLAASMLTIPAGTQRWINIEITLYSYVESTLFLSWIWKLKPRWNFNFEPTLLFNVD